MILRQRSGVLHPHAVFRAFLRVAAAGCLLLCVHLTWRWPLVGDAQVLHYVTFLMHHGFAPYRDIGDMNMPGAYLFEGWALALFGASNEGWRVYDFSLTLAIAASMIAIARRYDWIAGLAAAVIFTVIHIADGPYGAGQRDQLMAFLFVLSVACLFEAMDRRKAWLMFPFAFASAMAASIKPTLLPVAIILLVLACVRLRRSSIEVTRYCFYSIGGFLLAIGIVMLLLMKTGSTSDFFYTLTRILPHYGGLRHLSWRELVVHSLPLPALLFSGLGLLAAVLRKTSQSWEEGLLLLCAFFGAFSYFAQGKGAPQHRYSLLAFLLLWVCIQISQALTERTTERCIAIAAILSCLLYLLPRELHRASLYPIHDGFTDALEADLTQLGVGKLQHDVQCFDIIDGCLTALYQLQIVQSTGATGDLLPFQPVETPAVDDARSWFGSRLQRNPPAVLVFSNAQYGVAPRSFTGKLATWPQFSGFLQTRYTLVEQRAFVQAVPANTTLGQDSADEAYRIYVRRDSPLAATAMRHR